MGNLFSRSMAIISATLRKRYLEAISEPIALKKLWRQAKPGLFPLQTPYESMACYEAGERLLDNRFYLLGREVAGTATSIWSKHPPNASWQQALHSFGWLDDLAAFERAEACHFAQTAVHAWLDAYTSYQPAPWRLNIVARRLWFWLLNADLLISEKTDRLGAIRFRKAVWVHTEWLFRGVTTLAPGIDRLQAVAVLVMATSAIKELAIRQQTALYVLDIALRTSLMEDGSVVGRSPSDSFKALQILHVLQQYLEQLKVEIPETVLVAITALARTVRFFRSGDGGLPCFHGGSERSRGSVEAVLAAIDNLSSPPRALPKAGYERLNAGRMAVYMDVGQAGNHATAVHAHASALAIEAHPARRRLIVNCGSAMAYDPAKQMTFRAEAAHSTLTVDNAPFTSRHIDQVSNQTALFAPTQVLSERKEEHNGIWLFCSHNGYVKDYGLTTSRRLYLSVDGSDFRGEDSLSIQNEADLQVFQRVIQKQHRQKPGQDMVFTARFHLHPDVSVTMVADGEAATLRLPHGETWVMRQAGGLLSLENSFYFGRQRQPEQTKQLVIRTAIQNDLAQFRWVFRRVGELEHLPQDLIALGLTTKDLETQES